MAQCTIFLGHLDIILINFQEMDTVPETMVKHEASSSKEEALHAPI